MCFYSAVGGWTIAYFIDALLGNGIVADKAALGAHFGSLVADPVKAIGFQALFLVLTALIVNREVSRGIELLNKIMLPVFMGLMVVIIIRGVTLPGAEKGLEYLFSWHPEAFSWSSLLAAMGFMFFSLCVGCGCMFTYGSYLDHRAHIVNNCTWVMILSVISSVLGGLMIMPAVFAFGLDPAGGPDLTFMTMPIVFSQIPFGGLFASLFYLCLVLAALTSAVSLLEIPVAYCVDELKMNRVVSTVVVTGSLMVIGSLCALSFGTLADVKICGRTFFDNFDFLTSNLGLPIGGLILCLLTGVTVWPKIQSATGLKGSLAGAFRFILTIVSPIVILTVLVTGLI
jgi:NSS family neurotransmitter:Na+ symporter